MRKRTRIVLITLLCILILIQFVRPPENVSKSIELTAITTKYQVPADVQHILDVSCYDCHSNNTRYPWYWKIQPVTWFMNGHIEDAKYGLNFSTFAAYSTRKQYKLFDNINREVKSGDMPLSSYTFIHGDALLNDTQKLLIANWTVASKKEIENKYPPDSFRVRNSTPSQ